MWIGPLVMALSLDSNENSMNESSLHAQHSWRTAAQAPTLYVIYMYQYDPVQPDSYACGSCRCRQTMHC